MNTLWPQDYDEGYWLLPTLESLRKVQRIWPVTNLVEFANSKEPGNIRWRNISVPSLQNSSDLKFRVTHTAVLWGWLWTCLNTVTIYSCLHLHLWWPFLEVKSLAWAKHFLQHYSLAHSPNHAAVGWGSIASERLLFDFGFHSYDFTLHNS